MNGSRLPFAALIPAGTITTSEGNGNIEDSTVMRKNISRYDSDQKNQRMASMMGWSIGVK
jgi:hypothetical protein